MALILLAVLLANLLVRAGAHAGLARAGALRPADPALPYRNAALFARLCAGDFSCLDEPRESRRQDIAACCRKATERDAIRWQFADLNGDGLYEAVWLNGYYEDYFVVGDAAPVSGIFLFQDGRVTCPLYDVNDYTEKYFIGKNGRLLYNTFDGGVGGFLSWESTYECRMDLSGGLTIGEGLCIYHLDAAMAECETDDWMPQQPGTYYGRYDPESGLAHIGMILAPYQTEPISKEEYEEGFLRLTGFAAEDPFA